MARIYLSSTYSDLIPYRKAVYDTLRALQGRAAAVLGQDAIAAGIITEGRRRAAGCGSQWRLSYSEQPPHSERARCGMRRAAQQCTRRARAADAAGQPLHALEECGRAAPADAV